jgi:hypothetical protein
MQSSQLAAEESVLQMMNRPALADLAQFNLSPTQEYASRLITIPTVYDMLQYELNVLGSCHPETLQICQWLEARGNDVLNRLQSRNKTAEAAAVSQEALRWKFRRRSGSL